MADKLDFKGAWDVLYDAIKTLENEASCDHYEPVTLETLHNNRPVAEAKIAIQAALRIADRLQSGYVSYEMCDSFYDYIDDGTEEKTVSSIFIAMSAQLIKEETEGK